MKTKLVISVLLLVAGILFLIASPMYADVADGARSGSMTEAVCGLPAVIFCAAGLVSVLSVLVLLVAELHRACDQKPL